ncbi:unnamed protein product, partial [Choristocarpus tenellus]
RGTGLGANAKGMGGSEETAPWGGTEPAIGHGWHAAVLNAGTEELGVPGEREVTGLVTFTSSQVEKCHHQGPKLLSHTPTILLEMWNEAMIEKSDLIGQAVLPVSTLMNAGREGSGLRVTLWTLELQRPCLR